MRRFPLTTPLVLLAFGFGAAALTPTPANAQPQRAAPVADQGNGFQRFITALWPVAQARGVTRATFAVALRGVTPDASIIALTKRQSEFVAPIWGYLNGAVSASRIARGRSFSEEKASAMASIERRYGVPSEIVLAIWGMETSFGGFKGDKDVIRSLATLASVRYRGDFFRDELITAMLMLQQGVASRADMKGSWAGAMGHTQFMPSSYVKHAVSFDGRGAADVWDEPLDALASTANYLKSFGWTPGLPWGVEVVLPQGYDWRLLNGPFAAFAAAGVRAASGRLPSSGEARLFFPAGHTGPAFLLTTNFDVIKTYNMSDAYALAVGHLADRIGGAGALRGAWPTTAPRLDKAQTQDLQRRLRGLGLYRGDGDGRIGSGTREAVRQYQQRNGLIPDGWPTPALLARLKGG